MAGIYQEIWDADQAEAGVPALLDTELGDTQQGFVKVNSNLDGANPELRVLPEVVIPDNKRRTYDLCRELFDNYALAERDPEPDSPEEREEVHDLVHAVADTAPMQVARDYVARATGTSLTRERWYNTLMDLWFRTFSMGGDPDLTGFEHVMVGEQQGPKAQGYHFWYKYHLDDGFAHEVVEGLEKFPGLRRDLIAYLGSKLSSEQDQFPETVTISYRWDAPDYDRKVLRPLTKKIGGFFVGCSVEGLMAMGAVRAHVGARAPKEATINGARYDLKLFRSANNRHIRTFYPVFLGPAEGVTPEPPPGDPGGPGPITPPGPVGPTDPMTPTVSSDIRILAAMVNPEGHDPGRETVTLINLGPATETLSGCLLEDKNGKRQALDDERLGSGDTLRVTLAANGVQLSNKGGSIRLLDGQGRSLHAVTYAKGQVRDQGRTILF